MDIQTLSRSLAHHAPLLKQFGIAVVYLFGSRAQQIERSTSDYDFGILLSAPVPAGAQRRQIYDTFYELLDGLIGQPVNIDIVFLHDAPLHLRDHVIRHGVILFETDPVLRGQFHEHTINASADFAFHRQRFEEATLQRIP